MEYRRHPPVEAVGQREGPRGLSRGGIQQRDALGLGRLGHRLASLPEQGKMLCHRLEHQTLGLVVRCSGGDNSGQVGGVRRIAGLVVALENDYVASHGRPLHKSVRCPTWYPTWVRKTSIYLDDSDVERLRRLAVEEGRSQAEIVRAALSVYERARTAPREFALEGAWAGDGSSIADVPEEDLLAGFGA
jgi:hypothetical protein